ncbi:MAG: CDP-diacylglycerol--serine O-phosphatidyltransferase, partial [Bacteroidota bacterium]
MKQHLPNLLTLLNLASGSLGTILALKGHLTLAALCIWIGGVLDFLDGWMARMLRAYSPLGQQLDSLADLVTFGLLPAHIMYALIDQYTPSTYVPLFSLLIPIFSALRLARFNIDPTQRNEFRGLPTPAAGLFVSTLPWIIAANRYAWLTTVLTQPAVLAGIAVAVAGLLVA